MSVDSRAELASRDRIEGRDKRAGSNLYTLFMQAPAIICVLRGPDHVFDLVNPLYRQLFGDRELLGKPVREAIPELEGQGFFELLDQVFRTGEPYIGRESRAVLKSGDGDAGQESFFNFIYQPMYDGRKQIEGVMVFAFEVTEQVRARREMEQLAESLRQANREKDEFIAVISHELRTPLTSILGWARMLRLGGLDEQTQLEALNAIERSTQAQVKLIEDLLDEARIASGKLRLEMRTIDLLSLLQPAVAGLVPAAEGKNILIDADLGSDPCPVLADPSRLQQVIWNVLSNAVKFTPHGGTISIRLRRAEDARIDIRDSGAGIEPELLPHIFDRFRQGDPGASQRRGGLGLGLAIARHLVALHGGTIEAQSEGEGRGTTFTIHLPLATATGERFVERDRDRKVALPRLDGIRVLIVDDEADNREVIAAIAQRCGAEAMVTATAASGLDVLRRWRPDMIVCDIALPDMDGCLFLERVRALAPEEGGQTPALALTVLSARAEQERILASGFQIYRQKPIEPADLAHDIARLAASRVA